MSPCPTKLNVLNRPFADAISPTELRLRCATSCSPNRQDIDGGEFRLWATFANGHQPCASGMSLIPVGRNPFEIDSPVIGLDTVDVIGLLPVPAWSDKSGENKPVDSASHGVVIAGKAKSKVTIADAYWRENVSYRRTHGCTCPTDSSEVGDLVPIFPTNSGSPFFGGSVRVRLHRELTPFGVTWPGALSTAATSIIQDSS